MVSVSFCFSSWYGQISISGSLFVYVCCLSESQLRRVRQLSKESAQSLLINILPYTVSLYGNIWTDPDYLFPIQKKIGKRVHQSSH